MKAKTLGIGIGLAAVAVAGVWWRRAQRLPQSSIAAPLDIELIACPACHGRLALDGTRETGTLTCGGCACTYPIVADIPHFIEPATLTGLNRRFSYLYDWFSWFYRLFSKVAFAYIGMPEAAARREVLDRLEPGGGRVLEVSIGPGVNLPYLVGRPDVGEVHGLDISLGQLRRCQSYLQRQGWAVPLYLGNAEELPFGDDTFDAVFHIGGINFFNDKEKAIAEMVRVAKTRHADRHLRRERARRAGLRAHSPWLQALFPGQPAGGHGARGRRAAGDAGGACLRRVEGLDVLPGVQEARKRIGSCYCASKPDRHEVDGGNATMSGTMVAIITGTSSWHRQSSGPAVGRAVAPCWALAARNAEPVLEALAAGCGRLLGGDARLAVPTDVADEAGCRNLIEQAVRFHYGRIDLRS